MGDDNRGAVGAQPLNRFLHFRLAVVVQRRGRFVQYQYRRVLVEGAGDGDALFLPAGEASALLPGVFVVTVRQFGDEIGGVGGLCREPHFGRVRRRVGVGDVGGDAGGEQHRVLRDEGDGAAAVGEADVGEVVSVDVDGARLRRVKTGEQRGDGRFAAARLADEGDGFAGADV